MVSLLPFSPPTLNSSPSPPLVESFAHSSHLFSNCKQKTFFTSKSTFQSSSYLLFPSKFPYLIPSTCLPSGQRTFYHHLVCTNFSLKTQFLSNTVFLPTTKRCKLSAANISPLQCAQPESLSESCHLFSVFRNGKRRSVSQFHRCSVSVGREENVESSTPWWEKWLSWIMDEISDEDIALSEHPQRIALNSTFKMYGDRTVVDDVTVHLNAGEVVGLLGPNGAGKSTAFSLLVGRERPSQGNVRLGNLDITKFPLELRARLGIGYLPQESSIFRGLSVRDNILLVLQETGVPRENQEARIQELLKEFRLEKVADSKGRALSGGERRRAELARALAANWRGGPPRILFVDEPFAGVDPIGVQEIQALLRKLCERDNIGIFITDHNVLETLRICDRAYMMYQGKVMAEGTPNDLFNNSYVKKYYLGENFVRQSNLNSQEEEEEQVEEEENKEEDQEQVINGKRELTSDPILQEEEEKVTKGELPSPIIIAQEEEEEEEEEKEEEEENKEEQVNLQKEEEKVAEGELSSPVFLSQEEEGVSKAELTSQSILNLQEDEEKKEKEEKEEKEVEKVEEEKEEVEQEQQQQKVTKGDLTELTIFNLQKEEEEVIKEELTEYTIFSFQEKVEEVTIGETSSDPIFISKKVGDEGEDEKEESKELTSQQNFNSQREEREEVTKEKSISKDNMERNSNNNPIISPLLESPSEEQEEVPKKESKNKDIMDPKPNSNPAMKSLLESSSEDFVKQ